MFGSFEFNPGKKKKGKEPGLEEAAQKLNEKIGDGKSSYMNPVPSHEEELFGKNFGQRFNVLQEKYNDIKQEILDKERKIMETQMRKSSLSMRAKRLTFKQLEMTGGDAHLIDMTRNAEDRMDALARKIKNEESDLKSLQEDLKELERTWEAVSGLVAITEESFDPNNN